MRVLQRAVLSDRAATLAEFEDYLRTTNSRDGRPYEEATSNAYISPGKTLDTWLDSSGIDGDFPALGCMSSQISAVNIPRKIWESSQISFR